MSDEAELKAELERLKAENQALKARGSKGVTMKAMARDSAYSRIVAPVL